MMLQIWKTDATYNYLVGILLRLLYLFWEGYVKYEPKEIVLSAFKTPYLCGSELRLTTNQR